MAETRDKLKEGIDVAAQGAKRLTDRASDTLQSAQSSSSSVIDSAKDVAGQAREKVREWASDAGEGVSQAADKVQHWAEDAYQYSGEHLGEFGREATTMIRRYPIQALAIGFCVGLLLGRASRV